MSFKEWWLRGEHPFAFDQEDLARVGWNAGVEYAARVVENLDTTQIAELIRKNLDEREND